MYRSFTVYICIYLYISVYICIYLYISVYTYQTIVIFNSHYAKLPKSTPYHRKLSNCAVYPILTVYIGKIIHHFCAVIPLYHVTPSIIHVIHQLMIDYHPIIPNIIPSIIPSIVGYLFIYMLQ